MPTPTVEQMRAALKARHAAELAAFEKFAPLLETLLPVNDEVIGGKKSSRAGTGKIRNAVLPAFSREFRSVDVVAQETGCTPAQVRGVVTAPVLKEQFAKKEIDGVMHYKFEGTDKA